MTHFECFFFFKKERKHDDVSNTGASKGQMATEHSSVLENERINLKSVASIADLLINFTERQLYFLTLINSVITSFYCVLT